MNSSDKGILDRAVGAHLKARNRILNAWFHDVTERWKMRRKGMARDAGLDDSYDVGTYPTGDQGDTRITVNDSGSGFVKGALLSAALLGGGAAGSLGLATMLGLLSPQTSQPPPAAERTLEPQEFEVEIGVKDGKPVVNTVRPVK